MVSFKFIQNFFNKMKHSTKHQRKKYYRLSILGTIFIILSGILFFNTQNIFHYVMTKKMIISPNERYVYDLWTESPFPISMDVYFFNWTNPEDINNHSIKPRLKEMGPYTFKEENKKVDVKYHNNGTISYKQQKLWYFDPDSSVGTLEDKITSLNPVAVSAVSQSSNLNYFLLKSLSFSFRTVIDSIEITKTVGEILFDGYEDTLMNIANNLPKMPNIDLPPFKKFGWFVDRNGSVDYEGVFSMGTGELDIPFGALNEWNYKNRSKYYKDSCSEIRGSAGEFFLRNLSKTDDLDMFFTDLCRPLSFYYEKEHEYKNMDVYKFIGNENTFDNGTFDSKNECYCESECVPSGITSVFQCKFGAPGFISFPHFYAADDYYQNFFEGLHPNKEKHEFFMLIEPITGIPMEVDGKFQVNLLLEANSNIGLFAKVPKLYFPILWFRQHVAISDSVLMAFKWFLAMPCIIVALAVIGFIVGIICVVPSIIIISTNKFSVNKYNTQFEQNEKELQKLNFNTISPDHTI